MASYKTTIIDTSTIVIDRDVLQDFKVASSQEWLDTNGIGGFASGTLARVRTRRYHGLLFAATKPPVVRKLLLNAFESSVKIDGKRYETSTNQYPDTVYPTGYKYLVRFRNTPWPTWTYRLGEVEIEACLWMVQGENTTVVEYRLTSPPDVPVALELRPILAFRDYHSLTFENPNLEEKVSVDEGLITLTPYSDMPPLYLAHNATEVSLEGFWYRRFQYREELARGSDFQEDGYSPLVFSFHLNFGPAVVIASTNPHQIQEWEAMHDREMIRRFGVPTSVLSSGVQADAKVRPLDASMPENRAQRAETLSADPLIRPLATATSPFIVSRGDNLETVIAGYPWFTDWGRDTFISLTGLTLVTGRYATARNILKAFAEVEQNGLIPNRFQDGDELPEYNTIDGTLWFVYAIGRYLDYTNDLTFVAEELYPTLQNIFRHHLAGTNYNIHATEDGLLYGGQDGVQLTWMDAKIGNWVVTPRIGKPVEIQALWYNGLRVAASIAQALGDTEVAAHYTAIASKAKASFAEKFWNHSRGCLFDVITDQHSDAALRPNQIYAMGLPYPIFDDTERCLTALRQVEQELRTPVGLRSLGPKEPGYTGRYEGDQRKRDAAYHQGTVWPFLMGGFVSAWIRNQPNQPEAVAQARQWLSGFEAHLKEAGIGSISEIFDGDAPHTPRGCIAQAWSVAEVYRCLVEDIYGNCPPVWGMKKNEE